MDKNVNVLIVEDHALTSFALKTSLMTDKSIGEVYEADTAESAYEILKTEKIDLIIMDLGLADTNGVEATRQIRKTDKEIKIIIVTSHCDKDEVIECLEAGINAYCTKDIKPEKLIEVVKDVVAGSMYFDSSVSKFVMDAAKKNNDKDAKFNKVVIKDCYNLTQQEKRVLILLSTGHNNLQIARELSISVNTTKVHVCAILQKMGVEDRTQAAIKAIREGLIE